MLTTEIINKDLKCWNKDNLTMSGQRHIINIVIGRRTQYWTRVQDMPKQVENILTRTMKEFFWNTTSTHPVGMATLRLLSEEGGRKILDLKSCNEVIEIIKIQRYLALDENRLRWAVLADKLLALNMAKIHRNKVRKLMTPFPQGTRINTRETIANVPQSLMRMIKIAKKHEVVFHLLTHEQKLCSEMLA